jgi:putative acetyltransferase
VVKPIEYEIRRAAPSDAEDIAAAHADSIRSIGPQFYAADTVNAWGSGLTSGVYVKAMDYGEVFWIAIGTLSGKHEVLGFSFHRVDENQHGTSVYVRGEVARRGIGSALFRVAEAAARRAGATSIDIAASLAAVEFYKAHGFEEVGRGEHRLHSGQPMPCIFMRKGLTGPDTRGRRTTG